MERPPSFRVVIYGQQHTKEKLMSLETSTIRNQAGQQLVELVRSSSVVVNEMERIRTEFATLRQQVSGNDDGEFESGDLDNVDTRIDELITKIKDFANSL